MDIKTIFSIVGFPADVEHDLTELDLNFDVKPYVDLLNELTDVETSVRAFEQLRGSLPEDEKNYKMLLCQLYAMQFVYEKYQNKGISDIIFKNSFQCFSRYLSETKVIQERWLFDRDWWTIRFLNMTIFRIGELEYEYRNENGLKLISIHIPSGADLSHTAIGESLAQAKEFTNQFFPDYVGCDYICKSWLMSVKLRELLAENSKILDFQRRFHIVMQMPQESSSIQFLFQMPYSTPVEQLREDTSLQRRAKKVLQSGGTIGAGYGVLMDFS